MKTKNWTQLIGYLGNDPVIKQCKNGRMLASFSLATNERIAAKGSDDGRVAYRPVWHHIMMWGDEVDSRLGNVMKGSHVLVEGKLQYLHYKDQSGQDRTLTRISASLIADLDR